MPQFDPELIQAMRSALEDIMAKSAPRTFDPGSEGIPCRVYLEGRRQGHTGYDALISAASDQIQVIFILNDRHLD